jgi:nucleotide-binding universal stress UspA family protein
MDHTKLLVAVDASENAERAVAYVGQMLGDRGEVHILLLAVSQPPGKELFPDEEAWKNHCQSAEQEYGRILSRAKGRLTDLGVPTAAVETRVVCGLFGAIAQTILHVRQTEAFGTIVVGRRGVSKAEEFLFGSVSNKIVNYARDCTVWVVE